MFGSCRFYIDKYPETIHLASVLDIIDMISVNLGAPYSQLIHTLYIPDKDQPVINTEYANDVHGRASFTSCGFIPLFIGRNGEASAPIITATCEGKVDSIYSKIRIEVQLPFASIPMIIRVDFDFSYATKPFTFKSFCFLLERLYHKGFRVNNSFYHVYRRRNTATTLDGGQIGSFSSLGDKRNIARAVAHRRKLSVNCIMDVFSINSVLCGSVSDNAKDRIAAIVGKHFVKTVADYFVFALPYQEAIDSIYYIQRYCKVNRLREIIKAEGLLS